MDQTKSSDVTKAEQETNDEVKKELQTENKTETKDVVSIASDIPLASPIPTLSDQPLASIDEEKKVTNTSTTPRATSAGKKRLSVETKDTPRRKSSGGSSKTKPETSASSSGRNKTEKGAQAKKGAPTKGTSAKGTPAKQAAPTTTGRPRQKSVARKKPKWQDLPWRLWGANEVSEWLKANKLEKYIETFIDCDCQGEDLELIGDQELQDDFEIESAEDRKLILDEIQKLIGSTKE